MRTNGSRRKIDFLGLNSIPECREVGNIVLIGPKSGLLPKGRSAGVMRSSAPRRSAGLHACLLRRSLKLGDDEVRTRYQQDVRAGCVGKESLDAVRHRAGFGDADSNNIEDCGKFRGSQRTVGVDRDRSDRRTFGCQKPSHGVDVLVAHNPKEYRQLCRKASDGAKMTQHGAQTDGVMRDIGKNQRFVLNYLEPSAKSTQSADVSQPFYNSIEALRKWGLQNFNSPERRACIPYLMSSAESYRKGGVRLHGGPNRDARGSDVERLLDQFGLVVNAVEGCASVHRSPADDFRCWRPSRSHDGRIPLDDACLFRRYGLDGLSKEV